MNPARSTGFINLRWDKYSPVKKKKKKAARTAQIMSRAESDFNCSRHNIFCMPRRSCKGAKLHSPEPPSKPPSHTGKARGAHSFGVSKGVLRHPEEEASGSFAILVGVDVSDVRKFVQHHVLRVSMAGTTYRERGRETGKGGWCTR